MSDTKHAKKEKKAVQKTVKMVRGEAVADVHPAEVDNYAKSGWVKK